MADIFLSYAREDMSRAHALASSLEGEGWTVWWDQQLVPGDRYAAETENILKSASVILVLWTDASIKSMWVADEAMIGREQGTLVPVSFDNARPPIGFRQIQTMAFDDWDGTAASPQFRKLADAICARLRAEGSQPSAPYTDDMAGATGAAPAPLFKPKAPRAGVRRAVAAAAGLLVIASASAIWVGAGGLKLGGASRMSVAVPPFEVSGANPELLWLSTGMAATLEKGLRASGIQTKGYDFPTSGRDGELAQYIEQLGVDYVLNGQVTRVGADLLFNVKLTDVQTRATVHAIERVESADVDFAVMQDVVNAVVSALAGDRGGGYKKDGGKEARIVRPQSKDYLMAVGLTSDAAVKADFEMASDLLRLVISEEPDNGEAYAQLAYALASADRLDDRSDRNADEARDAIKKAFQILGENSEAHFANGLIEYVYREGSDRLKRARDEFAHAIRLDPGNARAIKWMTSVLIQLGDYNEAIAMADKALEISPNYLDAIGNRISALVFVGRRKDARAELDAMLEKRPDWSFAHRMRASVALTDGDLLKMLEHVAVAEKIEPIVLNARLDSIAYANLAMKKEAEEAIERDSRLSKLDPSWSAYKKQIVAGDIDAALASLNALLVHETQEGKRADPLTAAGFLRIYRSDFKGAREYCAEALEYNRRLLGDEADMSLAGACAAIAAARLGEKSEALSLAKTFEERLSKLPGEYRPYWDLSILASLYVAVNDKGQALKAIKNMVAGGWRTPNTAICRHCVHLAVDDERGLFGALRADPEFIRLMAEVRSDLDRQRRALGR